MSNSTPAMAAYLERRKSVYSADNLLDARVLEYVKWSHHFADQAICELEADNKRLRDELRSAAGSLHSASKVLDGAAYTENANYAEDAAVRAYEALK